MHFMLGVVHTKSWTRLKERFRILLLS